MKIILTICTVVAFTACGESMSSLSSVKASADANAEGDDVNNNDSADTISTVDVVEADASDVTQDTKTQKCTSDADCNDGNWCTEEACKGGVCKYAIYDDNMYTRSCEADGNPCTADYCITGVCKSMQMANIQGCTACKIDADCDKAIVHYCSNDHKLSAFASPIKCGADSMCVYNPTAFTACTLGCVDSTGKCKVAGIDCTSDIECDDNDHCTTDSCGKGVCSNWPKNDLSFIADPSTPSAKTITAGEVDMIKFGVSAPLGTDITVNYISFELNGSISADKIALVKLYLDKTVLGTATVKPNSNVFEVGIGSGITIKGGTTETMLLSAEISSGASGVIGFRIIGEIPMVTDSACTLYANHGLPLQGQIMTIK